MDRRYDPAEIEPRRQALWRERDVYRTPDISDRPKYYCLDFFPYPSGDGLSVGHCRNYVPTDAVSLPTTLPLAMPTRASRLILRFSSLLVWGSLGSLSRRTM